MTEEEKKAYKKCKEFAYIKMSPLAEAVDILLNLIEKQEKELNQLTEENEMLKGMFKKSIKE